MWTVFHPFCLSLPLLVRHERGVGNVFPRRCLPPPPVTAATVLRTKARSARRGAAPLKPTLPVFVCVCVKLGHYSQTDRSATMVTIVRILEALPGEIY